MSNFIATLYKLTAAAGFLLVSGCWLSANREVVVYCALDREFSEPLLQDFERDTGIRVLAKYDVESTKTVGLVSAIIQEQKRPRCDVFWNNEILHTLRLDRMNLLADSPAIAAVQWPEAYRAYNNRWIGCAARARVLIVNTQLVPPDQRPKSIQDLVDQRWAGKVGIAKPLFGTTATHASVLFAQWGEGRAKAFFDTLKKNASVLSGNKQVAEAVGRGDLAFGLTDTDDAVVERDAGKPVEIVFPDQDVAGTLFIPNSLCVIKGSANQEAANKLIAYLLRPEVERRLASGPSAQFPVNSELTELPRVAPKERVKWMNVDFLAAMFAWDTAAKYLRLTFATAED